MNQEKVLELLEKFANNDLDKDGELQLSDWIKTAGNESIKAVMEQYESIVMRANTLGADAGLFQKIKEKIRQQNEEEISLQEEEPMPKVRKLFPWRSVAAAAVILIMLGVAGYFILYNRKVQEPIAKVVPHDITAPKITKAIITLANGKQIPLDSVNNGTLATQGNIKITKLANGQITYTTSSRPGEAGVKPAEIAYNTLTNPRGSEVINMTLADGSRVWLNAGSSVTYPIAFSGNERKVNISGEAYFEVFHDASRPFIVENMSQAPAQKQWAVQVLGTHFNVNAYLDEPDVKVTLLQGSVKVSGSSQQVRLKPGEQAQLSASGSIKTENHVVMDEVIAWKEGYFHFEDADLNTILRQFSRWYDVEVVYNGVTSNRKFFGIVKRSDNLSKVLEMLKDNNIKFEIEGKKLILKSG